ncbi:CBS domain-containing protein [Candidatus Nitrosotenuis cloacae]|uniref:CBS domain-containing protein n=1 Tax=Candidatus Nitrosotenuis cloacae TaxID=1603555 RepID=UPI0022809CF7|nr:CBS domain-containing protein [Candidatus Nitrosotenuis cloacae]
MANLAGQTISDFMDPSLVIQNGDQIVSEAVRRMAQYEVDSLLVSIGNEVKGMVTYRDILFDVVSKGKDPTKTTLREIMKTPLITITRDVKINDAISLMNKNNVRRLVVLDNGMPVGLVSQKLLAGNIARQAIPLPELEMPNKIRCPYCSSIFDDKTALSSHIDNIHIGRGLFEGNLARAHELGSINPAHDSPKTL